MKRLIDLQPGNSLPSVELGPVSRLDLIKYAGASGDFNPIYTIDQEALDAGLPEIIAHGMWTMGNLAKLFTPYLNEGFIQEYAIRFSGMVLLDDMITLQAELDKQAANTLYFHVAAVNQQQKGVMKGHIVFELNEWVKTA